MKPLQPKIKSTGETFFEWVKLLSTVFLALLMATLLPSCKNDIASMTNGQGGNDNKPEEENSLVQSCKRWGSANLCLSTEGTRTGTIITPTLTFKGLDKTNGSVQLFSDSTCSTSLGSPIIAKAATVEVIAPIQSTFAAEYYARYTHTDNTKSPCLGSVAWMVTESPTLAFVSSAFSIPTLSSIRTQAATKGIVSGQSPIQRAKIPEIPSARMTFH